MKILTVPTSHDRLGNTGKKTGLWLEEFVVVEDMLKENGGLYSKASNCQPHVVVDANLITGQNPASAQAAANVLLDQLSAQAVRQRGRHKARG